MYRGRCEYKSVNPPTSQVTLWEKRLIEFEETYKSLVGVVELTNINQQVKARYNLDSSL